MGANVSTVYETSPTKTNESPTTKVQVISKTNELPMMKGQFITNELPTTKGLKGQFISNELPTTKGQVIAFHSSSKWKNHFEASKQTSKLIVIDFTASWCGPCQYIQPAINEFAETYKDVDFIKIDVDELDDVAQEFGVQAMPTFVLIKRGKEVDKVVGAKKEDLKQKIEKHRI